ncbi:MAG: hypothetical protein ACEQSK_10775, partial [Sphingomonadaceae bacterium]
MRTALTTTALAILLALGGCAIIVVPDDGSVRYETAFGSSSSIQGNGQLATEQRSVGSLRGLDLSGPLQVEVRVGAHQRQQVAVALQLQRWRRADPHL